MTTPPRDAAKPAVAASPSAVAPDARVTPAPGTARLPAGAHLQRPLSLPQALLWALGAVICFHLAYSSPILSYFVLGYLLCLVQLARLATGRQAFYVGLAVGLFAVAPQLYCFWVIFGRSAIVLWLILAFWIGLFVSLARLCLLAFGPLRGALLVPLIWTGLEYFRSELYYLRFSWLNVGYALSGSPVSPLFHWLGTYGTGFLAMAAAVTVSLLRPKRAALFAFRLTLLVIVLLFLHAYFNFNKSQNTTGKSVLVAGVQLEFPTDAEVLIALDKLLVSDPATELLVLSEYTFDGPVPEKIRNWCREHQRYLIVGGKDPAPKSNFYDTAFVVGPAGDIVFRQVKSVPIQFFKDGLPATEQKLWDSPWGKIGLCVCYDLSYTVVIDRLIRNGAQAIIVPTMDVVDWGRRQHELHARVAPVRAAEYGIPIFRVASSGISQCVDRNGQVLAKADFSGEGQAIAGQLVLANAGSLPLDRWWAPFCTGATGLIACLLFRSWSSRQRTSSLP